MVDSLLRMEDIPVLMLPSWLLESSVWVDVCEVGEKGPIRLRVGVACSRVMAGEPERQERSGVDRDREILRRRLKDCCVAIVYSLWRARDDSWIVQGLLNVTEVSPVRSRPMMNCV